jgi:DNA-directed RNA polymerase specialized sigma24 family protein
MSHPEQPASRNPLAPETRHSWIEEVQKDGEYAGRLIELCELYGPYIEGLCRARGLSQADAEILTQQIQEEFSAKLRHYQRREGKPFHGWLSAVIGNAVIDWQRRRQDLIHLNQHSGWEADLPAPEGSQTSEITQELTARSLVFVDKVTEAIVRVRERVGPRTWEAFVAYKLPEGPSKETSVAIAKRLGFETPDAVRMASGRVLKMIKEETANRLGLQVPSARALRTIKEKLASLRQERP